MSVHLGNIKMQDIPLGGVPVAKAYLGDVLVFQKGGAEPYLEIAPELIWVYPDWAADNDVYSNVTWIIN